jgi:hypothetical protein
VRLHLGPEKDQSRFYAARVVVYEAAKELLTPEELKGTTSPGEDQVLLYLAAPSKRQLLDGLLTAMLRSSWRCSTMDKQSSNPSRPPTVEQP